MLWWHVRDISLSVWYIETCLLSFECPRWHYIHSVWSIKQAGPTLTQEIHFNTQHQRRGRSQLPKKGIWLHFYHRKLLPETCCMYLSSQNLSSLSLIAWSPSLSLCQSFLSSHLSLALESLLPLQWLMTGKGQHHLPWVSQWVTTNGHFFLWLGLVLKKLSELHIGVASWELHIGETEVMHVLNHWSLNLWSQVLWMASRTACVQYT